MPSEDHSLDVLGIKPIGKAVEKTTDATLKGASAFLSRICLPAAEEFGLFLQDKVRSWRATNASRVLEKAQVLYDAQDGQNERHVHPLLLATVLDNGSWADKDEVQSMWAGLLASSCTSDGQDQNNLIFMDILKRMTHHEVRLLSYSCKNAHVTASGGGWISAEENLKININKLIEICETDDIHQIDFILDHCRELGIFLPTSGFDPMVSHEADITPSGLGLQLYVRAHGFVGSPLDYFSNAEQCGSK